MQSMGRLYFRGNNIRVKNTKNINHGKLPGFIGTSIAMRKVFDKIQRIASSDIPVFITGDTGTGKEICAEFVHYFSKRQDAPFIPLNCAGLSPHMIDSALFGHVKGAYTGANTTRLGAIEKAEGGTLFLDEVCEMPLESQGNLLRFAQKLEYQKLGSDGLLKANVRIICATNKDPYDAVKKKKFREDLYYRLFCAPIKMPTLLDRGNDIIDMAYLFLENFSGKYNKNFEEFSDPVLNLFMSHDWPGNVRELENLIHQIVSSYNDDVVTIDMIPTHIGRIKTKGERLQALAEAPAMAMPLWRVEKRAIEQALYQSKNNVQKAAEILDVAPSTIYRKMKSWQSMISQP